MRVLTLLPALLLFAAQPASADALRCGEYRTEAPWRWCSNHPLPVIALWKARNTRLCASTAAAAICAWYFSTTVSTAISVAADGRISTTA